MIREEKNPMISIFQVMQTNVYFINDDYSVEFMNDSTVKDFGEGRGTKCYFVLNQNSGFSS